MSDQLKKKLMGDSPVLGTMLFEFATIGVPHVAAHAGADFLVLDTEHSPWTEERVANIVAAGRAAGIPTLVRVAESQRSMITRPLDSGAAGLMIPMVESAEQAAQVVSWTRYPPSGSRGAAFGVAHDGYRIGDVPKAMEERNRDLVVIALIETQAGLSNLDAIAQTDGIDVLWVGHFDLTSSLGIPGEFTHPRYLEAIDDVVTAAERAGKPAGFMVSSAEEGLEKVELGFRCLAYWGDLWLYGEALRQGLADIRRGQSRPTERPE